MVKNNEERKRGGEFYKEMYKWYLAMQGVPLDFIAKLGGWKKLETLKKYLLASGLDVAMVAAEYDFFR
mgnify:CR=1 FL=1